MSSADAFVRVAKCRGGVLLDTNVLLLLLVGMVDTALVEKCSRSRAYTSEDYLLLTELLKGANRLVLTPHVATEAWDLGENALAGDYQRQFRDNFASLIVAAQERSLELKTYVEAPYFQRLGVADAAIVRIKRRRPLVITDDVHLYRQLELEKHDVVNFTHLRNLG